MLEWLWSYQRKWLPADLVAGLTAAAVVLPKALAYATIAGLPVQVGLYTAFVPPLVYAIVGTWLAHAIGRPAGQEHACCSIKTGRTIKLHPMRV